MVCSCHRQKEILSLLVKNKGQFKTPTIPKDHSEKNLDNIVSLYLKGLLTFERKYDIEYVGPTNEHMVRFKWYVLNIDKKKTIKDIKNVIKVGQVA